MKKKIIPIILITLLVLSPNVCAFSDIDNHWAKDSIENFNKSNILKGYGDNTFKPDNYLTRAEMVTILNRITGVTKESSRYIPDIVRQDWYYAEIRKAVQSGIMYGDENGYTKPQNFITREEAVVMLARAFGIEDEVSANVKFKDDDEISIWAKKSLKIFALYGYVNGYEDNTIRPRDNITRAELVTIINRIFNEIAVGGFYENTTISGNMIVMGKNVVLKDVIIDGNLIVSEGTKETIAIKNVEVKGDLILREDIDTSEIFYNGRKILLYLENDESFHKYENEEFGIEFSIPTEVKVIEVWKENKVDYEKENLILVNVMQSEEYYLQNINTIGRNEIGKVDNMYVVVEQGKFGNVQYILYKDSEEIGVNNFMVIKRDNTVYTMLFNEITIPNLIDNVLGTLNFFETDNVIDRKSVIYKKNKLNLKFKYREGYVGVDDSYNTNNIYSGDAPIKLFIQVNTITDIQEYSFDEVIYLLKNLAKKDGILKKTETLKIYEKDAVKFEIVSEDKLIHSLYVIDGNILYNFIFIANENIMNEVGEEFFDEVVNSLDF